MRDPVARPIVEVSRVHAQPSADVVDLFRRSFSTHPAARLGARVASGLLTAFAKSGAMFVARSEDGELLGFAVGGATAVLDAARADYVRRNAVAIASEYLRAGRSRAFVMDVLQRIRGPKRAQDPLLEAYQLRLISVSPFARRMGVGTLLIDAFEQTLPAGSSYHAWTLAGAAGAEPFYRSLGFMKDLSAGGHVRFSRRLAEEQR